VGGLRTAPFHVLAPACSLAPPQSVAVSLKLAAQAYVLENGRITVAGRGEVLLAGDRVRQAYLGM
jgi:ABC-type branched-subunit amino acid transport system ATPase component